MRVTRRSFAKTAAAGLWPGWAGAAPVQRGRVVIARDPKTVNLAGLLDRAMQAYFGTDNPVEAWRRVVKPGETVGLKVNCLAGKGGSTSVPLVELICERLQQAGIRQEKIIIWDRLSEDLESAGFRPTKSTGRIQFLGNDVLGYESELSVYGSAGSRLAKTLTQLCDVVINLPVLKDHGIVGVTMALKNMFGAIHNPNKYHPNAGDPYVADVNMLPEIRGKVRLTICDALRAQYEGGPTYMPQWTWPYNGLLVSQDLVALDTVGWQILERKRAEMGLKPLREVGREPKYIATAADANHRLGVNDPKRIERVEV
ncbi:MAG: DUF362 domain-containing protein [Bryobacteraceae bacterium]|nr:DUF362 domain-containing protein [Bryobacteraceae bacterium]